MFTFVIDLWGPRACFTPPYAKVERLSTAVPTPSAIRGILDSIYLKPSEFYWSVDKIEVLNPIKYQAFRRNEVKVKLSGLNPIDSEANHTQRAMTMLKDVRYRVTATLHPRGVSNSTMIGVAAQAKRRIEMGQCFQQPYFGIRECECYFAMSDMMGQPIPVTQDFGLMIFDTHVPYDTTRGSSDLDLSLYHCIMVDGVIQVPAYDSKAVLKFGTAGATVLNSGGGIHA